MTIDELQHLVASILGIADVVPRDRLMEDLDAESMDVVNIVAAIEDRLGIEIDELLLARVSTVADLHGVVVACVGRG